MATVLMAIPMSRVQATMRTSPLTATAATAVGPSLPTKIMSTIEKAFCKTLATIMGRARAQRFFRRDPLVRSRKGATPGPVSTPVTASTFFSFASTTNP